MLLKARIRETIPVMLTNIKENTGTADEEFQKNYNKYNNNSNADET